MNAGFVDAERLVLSRFARNDLGLVVDKIAELLECRHEGLNIRAVRRLGHWFPHPALSPITPARTRCPTPAPPSTGMFRETSMQQARSLRPPLAKRSDTRKPTPAAAAAAGSGCHRDGL